MSHIEDRWKKVVDGRRERTVRFGKGLRWRARYADPNGRERSQMFARKADAERFLTTMSVDVLRGAYVDPSAGRVSFRDFAAAWLEARTFDESTRVAVELRLRRHAYPDLGDHELRDLRPSTVQAWIHRLQGELAPRYVRVVLANLSSVLAAAVDDGLIARNPCRAGSVKAPPLDPERVVPWPPDQVEKVIGALPAATAHSPSSLLAVVFAKARPSVCASATSTSSGTSSASSSR
jgi:hypothetical protein